MFYNGLGQSLRLAPTEPIIIKKASSIEILSGLLHVEINNQRETPLQARIKASDFSRLLFYDGSDPVSTRACDKRSLTIKRYGDPNFDRWIIWDNEAEKHISCGFDNHVYIQAKAIISSLFYWSYGFNFLRKSSRVHVKHFIWRKEAKSIEFDFSFQTMKSDNEFNLHKGCVNVRFKQGELKLPFSLKIGSIGKICAHDFYKEKPLFMTFDDKSISLRMNYSQKESSFYFTTTQSGKRICFQLDVWEFEQLRCLFQTAIPVLTGFDLAFE